MELEFLLRSKPLMPTLTKNYVVSAGFGISISRCCHDDVIKVLKHLTTKALSLLGIGVFSEWSKSFIEFSEFRESDTSLKHELGSI